MLYNSKMPLWYNWNTSNILENTKEFNQIHKNFYNKVLIYLEENNSRICGDIMEILVNILTDVSSFLICIPFKYIK